MSSFSSRPPSKAIGNNDGDDDDDDPMIVYEIVPRHDPFTLCDMCGKKGVPLETIHPCGRCFQRGYCSEFCQKRDWVDGGHEHTCENNRNRESERRMLSTSLRIRAMIRRLIVKLANDPAIEWVQPDEIEFIEEWMDIGFRHMQQHKYDQRPIYADVPIPIDQAHRYGKRTAAQRRLTRYIGTMFIHMMKRLLSPHSDMAALVRLRDRATSALSMRVTLTYDETIAQLIHFLSTHNDDSGGNGGDAMRKELFELDATLIEQLSQALVSDSIPGFRDELETIIREIYEQLVKDSNSNEFCMNDDDNVDDDDDDDDVPNDNNERKKKGREGQHDKDDEYHSVDEGDDSDDTIYYDAEDWGKEEEEEDAPSYRFGGQVASFCRRRRRPPSDDDDDNTPPYMRMIQRQEQAIQLERARRWTGRLNVQLSRLAVGIPAATTALLSSIFMYNLVDNLRTNSDALYDEMMKQFNEITSWPLSPYSRESTVHWITSKFPEYHPNKRDRWWFENMVWLFPSLDDSNNRWDDIYNRTTGFVRVVCPQGRSAKSTGTAYGSHGSTATAAAPAATANTMTRGGDIPAGHTGGATVSNDGGEAGGDIPAGHTGGATVSNDGGEAGASGSGGIYEVIERTQMFTLADIFKAALNALAGSIHDVATELSNALNRGKEFSEGNEEVAEPFAIVKSFISAVSAFLGFGSVDDSALSTTDERNASNFTNTSNTTQRAFNVFPNSTTSGSTNTSDRSRIIDIFPNATTSTNAVPDFSEPGSASQETPQDIEPSGLANYEECYVARPWCHEDSGLPCHDLPSPVDWAFVSRQVAANHTTGRPLLLSPFLWALNTAFHEERLHDEHGAPPQDLTKLSAVLNNEGTRALVRHLSTIVGCSTYVTQSIASTVLTATQPEPIVERYILQVALEKTLEDLINESAHARLERLPDTTFYRIYSHLDGGNDANRDIIDSIRNQGRRKEAVLLRRHIKLLGTGRSFETLYYNCLNGTVRNVRPRDQQNVVKKVAKHYEDVRKHVQQFTLLTPNTNFNIIVRIVKDVFMLLLSYRYIDLEERDSTATTLASILKWVNVTIAGTGLAFVTYGALSSLSQLPVDQPYAFTAIRIALYQLPISLYTFIEYIPATTKVLLNRWLTDMRVDISWLMSVMSTTGALVGTLLYTTRRAIARLWASIMDALGWRRNNPLLHILAGIVAYIIHLIYKPDDVTQFALTTYQMFAAYTAMSALIARGMRHFPPEHTQRLGRDR